jgi:predicted RNA binding protein YcfA (HicA-like mRNA interferase family)
MKLPRDLSGEDLARYLNVVGYRISRQTGSHLRLTTEHKGEHHVTIPKHAPLRVGTLSRILNVVAQHLEMDKQELLDTIFSD